MKSPLFTLAVSVLFLAGCATQEVKKINKDLQSRSTDASTLLSQARGGEGPVRQEQASAVEHVSELWLPVRKASDMQAQSAAKDAANRRISVNRTFQTLQEVAERVTALTGIPVHVAPDALVSLTDEALGITGNSTGQPIGAPGTPLPPLPGITPGLPGITGVPYGAQIVNLSFDGTLAGFLNVVAARFGVTWEWNGNSVQLYRYTTKTFRLAALPGDSTLQNTISNQTGTGSANSNSTSGVSFDNLSVWTAVREAIQGMLSKKGSVTVTAATGTVTVTDTPQIVDQVEKFVETQNASLGKQVVVNVRVLSVDLNSDDEYGINWGAVYNSLSGNWGMSLASAPTASANAGTLALKILGTPGSGVRGDPSIKAWSGSQAIISALSTQGHVSQVTSASLTTMNNQPAPLQVGRQTAYLASSSTTVTQGVGAMTSLTQGTVTTGFSMSLVPHMLDKGRLMMQFAMNISSLLGMATITSGDATIQAPDIDTRNFLQRVLMNSGDTLILTGFEQTNLRSGARGIGSAENTALGGGVSGARSRSVLVILLQPVVAGEAS